MARITNHLAYHTMTGLYCYDTFINWRVGSIQLGPYVGDYKSISTDTNTGNFVPGTFRVNPVVIKTGHGEITPGRIYAFKQWGANYYGIDLNGCYVLLPYDGNWGIPYIMLYGSWDANLAQLALTRARANMNKAAVETGVILGELIETLELIRHPLRSLVKGLTRVARARSVLRTTKAAVDVGTNEWLKVQYGILPLIKDIQSIMHQYHSQMTNIGHHLRRQTAREHRFQDSYMAYDRVCQVNGSNFGTMPLTTRLQAFVRRDISLHATVYYQHLLNMEAYTLSKSWGLSPDDGLVTLWQLVPYSFVVDWFVDVGNWLRAISPNHSLSVLGNSISMKTTYDCSVVSVGQPMFNGSWYATELKAAKFVWHSETLERRVNNTLPVLPVWTGSWINFQKTVNSLAMLWQKAARLL